MLTSTARMTASPSNRVTDREDIVKTFRDVFPPALVQRLEEECKLIAAYERELPALLNGKYRTRWFPKGQEPRTAIEEAIVRLRDLVKPHSKNVGAEWWVQLVAAGPTGMIGWHVDKDESVASNKHYLSHPQYASIFYLTDLGGPTMITDQWSPHGSGYTPVVAEHGYLSFPERNKYLIFHGELLHGVLSGAHNAERPAPPGAKRLTFLVNWWDYKPEEPNCSLLDYSAVKGLKTFNTREELEAFRAEVDRSAQSPASRIPYSQRPLAPTPEKDLTTKTKQPWYMYNFRLPGGATDSLRVPHLSHEDREQHSTFHLIWHPRWFKSIRDRHDGLPGPQDYHAYNDQDYQTAPNGGSANNAANGNGPKRRKTAAEARAERERRDREL